MTRQEYSIYTDMPLPDYAGYLEQLNNGYLAEVRQDIASTVSLYNLKQSCFVVIGSDGKRERHPQSRTEIIALQTTAGIINGGEFMDGYTSNMGLSYRDRYEVGYDGLPAVRTITTDLLSHPYADHKTYPDALLNATVVAGNPEIYALARKKILGEMSLDHTARKIRKQMKSQRGAYAKTMETGMSRGSIFFTQDPPQQFYSEKPDAFSTGFKPFLRIVQRGLDILTSNSIRSGILTIEQAASFSTTTVNRIASMTTIANPPLLTEAYLWFLQRYHDVQEVYKNARKHDRVRVEREFVKDQFDYYKQIVFDAFNPTHEES